MQWVQEMSNVSQPIFRPSLGWGSCLTPSYILKNDNAWPKRTQFKYPLTGCWCINVSLYNLYGWRGAVIRKRSSVPSPIVKPSIGDGYGDTWKFAFKFSYPIIYIIPGSFKEKMIEKITPGWSINFLLETTTKRRGVLFPDKNVDNKLNYTFGPLVPRVGWSETIATFHTPF